MMQDM